MTKLVLVLVANIASSESWDLANQSGRIESACHSDGAGTICTLIGWRVFDRCSDWVELTVALLLLNAAHISDMAPKQFVIAKKIRIFYYDNCKK